MEAFPGIEPSPLPNQRQRISLILEPLLGVPTGEFCKPDMRKNTQMRKNLGYWSASLFTVCRNDYSYLLLLYKVLEGET
jgi:hypothetical protein